MDKLETGLLTSNGLYHCCLCGKIKVNENWVGEEYSDYFTLIKEAKNQISDGYCPACLEGVMEIVHREKLKEKIWDEDWE